LEAGMFITIEPGCYFNPTLLEDAYKDERRAKHLVREEIDKFTNFGGVRIEDDVLVTEDGIENFTVVPSSIDEVEAILAQNPFIFPKNKKE
jgi:Xaa-Pro dipeptidase